VLHKLPFIGNNPTQTLKLILDASYPTPARSTGRSPTSWRRSSPSAWPGAHLPLRDRQQLREALSRELARLGIEDPAKELAQFFRDPSGYSGQLKARLISQLLSEAEGFSQGRSATTRTIKLADRVLALETKTSARWR
jgi:hypothetical protein